MSKKPKTQDLEWLIASLNSFNGSGYADMSSPEDFLETYVAYKTMKNESEALMLVERHRQNVLPVIEILLAKTVGASRYPSKQRLEQFRIIRDSLR